LHDGAFHGTAFGRTGAGLPLTTKAPATGKTLDRSKLAEVFGIEMADMIEPELHAMASTARKKASAKTQRIPKKAAVKMPAAPKKEALKRKAATNVPKRAKAAPKQTHRRRSR
jgi:hypothetical protein